MDRLARAVAPVRNRRVGTPVMFNRIAVEMGLPGRFAHSLYDDQDQVFRGTSRRAGKSDPEVAIFGHGRVSFPIVASHRVGQC